MILLAQVSASGVQLAPQTAAIAIAIGLVFALGCYLATNLSPGGMITPGWCSVILVEEPGRILIVVGVAAVTYGLSLLAQKVVLLYGKRLFAAVVLIGLFVQVSLLLITGGSLGLGAFAVDLSDQTLGYVVPGLIAYQVIRQPPVATVLAVSLVTLMNYAILFVGLTTGLIRTFG